MARAPGMPLAQSSTLKPFGTLSFETGISLAGVSVILPGCGASFESAMLAGMPCFQAGGFGLSWAWAGRVKAAAIAAASAMPVGFFIGVASLGAGGANPTPAK